MKILLVAPYFKDSFAGKISMGSAVMAAHQLSRRHEVLVITTGREKRRDEISAHLTVLSAPALLLPDPVNYVFSPASLFMTIRAIREFRPDLVIVNKFMFFTSFAAPIARLLGKPTVVVTDTYPGLNWFPRNRFVGYVMWLYARLIGVPILRSANKVVLLHEGLEELAQKYRLDYTVIHNGPDLAAADGSKPARDLDKPNGEVWIGYVGRLESVKGYDYLIAATRALSKRHPGVRVLFLGARRPQEVRESEHLVFLGFRDDVFSVLKRMDIFCLPSLSEGLPNALMEAMAVRLPVVASRVGGVETLVAHEHNGLLVPSEGVGALEAALERLIESPELRERLGAEARATIERDFNWVTILEAYERVFDAVLGRERETETDGEPPLENVSEKASRLGKA